MARTTITPTVERDLFRRLQGFRARFRDGRDASTLLRRAIRFGMRFFDAREGCVAKGVPGGASAAVTFSVPKPAQWDADELGAFIRSEQKVVAPDTMLCRIRRRGRKWGVLCVRDRAARFDWNARHAFSEIGKTVTELLERMDDDRLAEVRARIERKIMEQLRPKDLIYQILDGLESLTSYDHSAALLMCDPEREEMEVVAERITWRKGKSRHIGRRLRLTDDLRGLLSQGRAVGFDRADADWRAWQEAGAESLAALVDYNFVACTDPHEVPEGAIICAPLTAGTDLLGLIKIAAKQPGIWGEYEASLLDAFLPHVSIALQKAQTTESLERRVAESEKQHAMADLARGVSHDVNNALGAVLPLVQQMRVEAVSGTLEIAEAARDLERIEHSLQTCRRIFSGMLRFARGSSRTAGDVSLAQEIDQTIEVVRDSLNRRKIALSIDVPDGLPLVRGVPSDVQQVLLNLILNARDAMDDGGMLSIHAGMRGKRVGLTIADTGCGISDAILHRIEEPFFTTKPGGNGLGLSICRSILIEMNGDMSITSTPGMGTRIALSFMPIEREGA